MIKARLSMGGRDTLILGLSDGNWARVRAGQSIHVDGQVLGYPGMRIILLGAATDDDLVEILRSLNLKPTIRPDILA